MRHPFWLTILGVLPVLLGGAVALADPPASQETPAPPSGIVPPSGTLPPAPSGAPIAFSARLGDSPIAVPVTAQGMTCTTPCTLTLEPGPTRVVATPRAIDPWKVQVTIPNAPARVVIENTGRFGYYFGPMLITLGLILAPMGVYTVAVAKEAFVEKYRPTIQVFGVFSALLGGGGVAGGIYLIVDANKTRVAVKPPRSQVARFIGAELVPAGAGSGAAAALVGAF